MKGRVPFLAILALGGMVLLPCASDRTRVQAQGNSHVSIPKKPAFLITNNLVNLPAPCGGHSPCWLTRKGAQLVGTPNPAAAQNYAYYQRIGATFDSWTLQAFRDTNQFDSTDEVTAFYFNNGDLQLGREMHCNPGHFQLARFACYVSNYGPPPFPVGTLDNGATYPNATQALQEVEDVAQNGSAAHSRPFATVAMVALSQPPPFNITVREADGVTGSWAPLYMDCLADYSGNQFASNHDVDTLIDIETGDIVTFAASGNIWTGYCFYGRNSADGLGWTADGHADYPLPSAHDSALIGKIGDGAYFEIGSNKTVAHSGVRGRLFLRTNDNVPGNGSGSFNVLITIRRDQLVRFYVYDNNGSLLPAAALDNEGFKSVPQMCMACHGGEYNPGTSTAVGSSFLPFDPGAFLYSNKAGLSLAEQQENFRGLNLLVKQTNPTPLNPNQPIHHLIDALYNGQVSVPNSKASSPATPLLWQGHDDLYQTFVARYCRTCHAANGPALDFFSYDQFKNAGVGSDLCSGQMPHAQVPYAAIAAATLNSTTAKDLLALDGLKCLVAEPLQRIHRRFP